MRVLVWHVHGGWMDAFVRGQHEYVVPVAGAPYGVGGTGERWPAGVREVRERDLPDQGIDVVVLQRPEDLVAAERLLGPRLGGSIPAIWVEHNTPKTGVPNQVHPLADRSDILIAHVTHFNELIWDTGYAPTTVVEHGIPDPGLRYTGEHRRLGVVINEPVRRWRVTGTDLLPRFSEAGQVEVFGIGAELLPPALQLGDLLRIGGNLPTAVMHERLAACRVYLHPLRWTSLGLSLLEAMLLGMPVIALATTEAPRAVPPEAGAISADVGELVRAARRLLDDPEDARARGLVAREAALARYGLPRFLARWDEVLGDSVESAARRRLLRVGSPGTADASTRTSTDGPGEIIQNARVALSGDLPERSPL